MRTFNLESNSVVAINACSESSRALDNFFFNHSAYTPTTISIMMLNNTTRTLSSPRESTVSCSVIPLSMFLLAPDKLKDTFAPNYNLVSKISPAKGHDVSPFVRRLFWWEDEDFSPC